MKKWKIVLVSLLGVTGLGLLGGWLAMRSWVQNNLTKEALVLRLESELNCRADIADVSVNLFSNPARISLADLTLRERDAEAGKPLADRKPPQPGAAAFSAGYTVLVVRWTDLLRGNLHISDFSVVNLWLRDEVSPEGVSSLAEVLKRPGFKPKKQAVAHTKPAEPSADHTQESRPQVVAGGVPSGAPAAPAPPAALLPLGLTMDSISFKNTTLLLINRQARTRTVCNELNLTVTDLDVDPSNLKAHNQMQIAIDGKMTSTARLKIKDALEDVKLADFAFEGKGVVHPLDPASGMFDPDAVLDLIVKQGSTFGGEQTIGEAAGGDKTLASMKKNLGIDISNVRTGGKLKRDLIANAKLAHGKLEFLNDVRLEFEDYSVLLHAGSWLDGGQDDHEFQLRLLPGDALAKQITGGLSDRMGNGVAKAGLALFNDGQGHLAIDLVSTGRLSKPKIRFGGQAGALEQMFKGVGGGLLNQLLKN